MSMLITLTLLLTKTIILIEIKNQWYAPTYPKASYPTIQEAPNNLNGTSNEIEILSMELLKPL